MDPCLHANHPQTDANPNLAELTRARRAGSTAPAPVGGPGVLLCFCAGEIDRARHTYVEFGAAARNQVASCALSLQPAAHYPLPVLGR